jgi:hypothetical protein
MPLPSSAAENQRIYPKALAADCWREISRAFQRLTARRRVKRSAPQRLLVKLRQTMLISGDTASRTHARRR